MRNLMIAFLLLAVSAQPFFVPTAGAQDGTYAASQKNKLYSAVFSLKVATEDGQSKVRGQIGFLKRGTSKLTTVKFLATLST